MIVRRAGAADVPAIRRISVATGQTDRDSGADPEYLRMLLTTATLAVCCDDRDVVVGWGAVRTSRGRSLLTDLFVDPDRQGRGVGAKLLRDLWPPTGSPRSRFTFSSRHASALPLYLRCGVVAGWPLLYLRGAREKVPEPGLSAHRVDAGTAAAADAALTDAGESDVTADYVHWARGHGGLGLVVYAGDEVVAAGAGAAGSLSHLTCAHERHAVPSLFAALRHLTSPDVTVCVPGAHPAVRRMLEAGFRVDDYDISMSTPDVTLPAIWAYSPSLG